MSSGKTEGKRIDRYIRFVETEVAGTTKKSLVNSERKMLEKSSSKKQRENRKSRPDATDEDDIHGN